MNKYKITINFEEIIEADTEEQANSYFWHNTVFDGNNNEGSFIGDNLKIEQV